MKTVLLFTGGMDSLIAHYFLEYELKKKHDLVYFNLKHKYSVQELKSAKSLAERITQPLYVYDFIDLSKFELPDATIPGRNFYLMIGAASLGYDDIYLIVQKGETTIPDRSQEFFKKSKTMLSLLFEKNVQVDSPFWDMTKQDMVKWYKDNNFPIDLLVDTWSCYSDLNHECGNCSACFRKYVALVYNDIKPKFELSDKIISYYKKRLLNGKYGPDRTNQTIEALKKVGLW